MAMEPEELARALGEAEDGGNQDLDPNNSAVIRIMAEKPEAREQLLKLVDACCATAGGCGRRAARAPVRTNGVAKVRRGVRAAMRGHYQIP